MKTCPLCGKEYDDELSVCPECNVAEAGTLPEATEAVTAVSEEGNGKGKRKKKAERKNKRKPKIKKKRPGLASAILGIVFPTTSSIVCLVVHISILFISAIIALLFPYLLALSPVTTPIINVITAVLSIIGCVFCLIGFLLSIVSLVAKGNKLGIAGLIISILSPTIIFAAESISMAIPSMLQRIFVFL